MKEKKLETTKTGVYLDYRSKLNEEYGTAFDKVEEYCHTQLVSTEEINESLSCLMDVFLEAQSDNIPVRKITGSDIGSFCRCFLSDVSPSARVRGVLEYVHAMAWIMLITIGMMFLPAVTDTKRLWAELSGNSERFYGMLLGMVCGCVLSFIVNCIVRQMIAKMKKYRKAYHFFTTTAVYLMGIGMLWLIPDFEMDVPEVPSMLAILFCVAVISITRLVMGFMNLSKGKPFFTRAEKAGTGQLSFRASVMHSMVEESRKMFAKDNAKREKKGLPAFTQDEYLEKYREDTKKSVLNMWIGLVTCAVVYVGFIVSEALTSALMDTLTFTLIQVVIFMLFSLTLFIYPVRIRKQFQQIMDESGKSFFDDDIYEVIDKIIS